MIIFLQNAWSPVYAGKEWPRRSWLRALEKSRSGQRLRVLCADWSSYHNVSRSVTATPRGMAVGDVDHVRAVLRREASTVVVVTCGLVARAAVAPLWPGALLCLPHPASRVLTNALYEDARAILDGPYRSRLALEQLRGRVRVVRL